MEKLRIKFSALNIDFVSRFSRLKETCARRHQRAVPPKSRYFTAVGKSTVQSSAAAHTPRMKCDEMAGDRLTVCEQELL